ncbi:MAG: hypothetical protein ACRDAM_15745 [Casimicrobium sp.]
MNRYEQWLADLESAMALIPSVLKVQREPAYSPEAEQRSQIVIDEGVWQIANGQCGCWVMSGSPVIRVLANRRDSRSDIVRDVLARLKPSDANPLSAIRTESFRVVSVSHEAQLVSGGAFMARINLSVAIQCKAYALDQAP